MRRGLLVLSLLCAPAAARADKKFVGSGADLEAPAGDAVGAESITRALLSLGGLYYSESASGQVNGYDPAATFDLLYTDLRGRAELEHIQGGPWGARGDFRLRLSRDDEAADVGRTPETLPGARGYLGGQELDLRELYVARTTRKHDIVIGRQIVADVAGTAIDGARMVLHTSPAWDLGAFVGLYPNPFSRDFDTDYPATATFTGYPVATGAWAGYRYLMTYGALGAAAILPRDDAADAEPARVFLTAQGYSRVGRQLDVFHYAVADVAGPVGFQIYAANVGAHWRAARHLTIEVGASHMATYAMEIYLRDLLESDQPPMMANLNAKEFLNNTAIIRMGSHEARLGGNYNFPGPRVDVHGQARYRRRAALDDADNLPAVVQTLPADQQLDLSAGVRHKRSLLGLTLGANLIVIRGDRTSDNIVTVRAGRGFLGDRLQLDADIAYIGYADQCAFMGTVPDDPTCTGQATGSTLRVGALLVWQRDRHWQVLGDYHYGWNASEKDGVPHPDVGSHQLFVRAQYTY